MSSSTEVDPIEKVVRLFGVLAHPVRLKVLLALEQGAELTPSELQRILEVEQSALSHQLRLLREARLVRAHREGKQMRYMLMDSHVAHILRDALIHSGEDEARDCA